MYEGICRPTIDEQDVRQSKMTEQAIEWHRRSGEQRRDARLGDWESRDGRESGVLGPITDEHVPLLARL